MVRAAGVPLAAVWLQDWVGKRRTTAGDRLWWNWVLDDNPEAGSYASWDAMRAALAPVRVLTYINNFLSDPRSSGTDPTVAMLHLLADTTETSQVGPPQAAVCTRTRCVRGRRRRPRRRLRYVRRGGMRARQPLPGSARGGAPGDRAQQALSGGLRRLRGGAARPHQCARARVGQGGARIPRPYPCAANGRRGRPCCVWNVTPFTRGRWSALN